ncbi:aftiphilin-like isoform X2 [Mercenaria mercenaria]|uniref:aftiphilin-like isoform X2 n=1 Tax=Mercenaria mercenaria TaxID=6596 RepID=UPI00234E5CA1|nr:aftiphilin-like isoform X2 [Mercenaria mercenaria]
MSNIIPMVSSSPPPMDEGGGFEWDDDDDDFGTFTSASDNSFAQSAETPSNEDTRSHDHFNSGPHKNDMGGFADFGSFSSKEMPDSVNKTVPNDHRPESISISQKTSEHKETNFVNAESNNNHTVNGPLVDSGVYSSNVSPIQYTEHSGSQNNLESTVNGSIAAKTESLHESSCNLDNSENTADETERSCAETNTDTGSSVPCKEGSSATQENVNVIVNSDSNGEHELQGDSVKCIPPKVIPDDDHMHISGSAVTEEEMREGEKDISANVVISNCDDSCSQDSDTKSFNDVNSHSVSNVVHQESGHGLGRNISQTDLTADSCNAGVRNEGEFEAENSSHFGDTNFANQVENNVEDTKSSVNRTECKCENDSGVIADGSNLVDQESNIQEDLKCSAVNSEEQKDSVKEESVSSIEISTPVKSVESETKSDKSENLNISNQFSQEEIKFVHGQDENDKNTENAAHSFDHDSENASVEDGINNNESAVEVTSNVASDIVAVLESENHDENRTYQKENDNMCILEDNSKPEDNVKQLDNVEEDMEPSEAHLKGDNMPVSDNCNESLDDNDGFSDFSESVNKRVKDGSNSESTENSNDGFGDFSTTPVHTEEEFNSSSDKKQDVNSSFNDGDDEDDFGDFNASFDVKPDSSISAVADDKDDFGDFNASFTEKEDDKELPSGDGFGDFSATFDSVPTASEQTSDWAAFSEPQTVIKDDIDDADDWAGFEDEESSAPPQFETVTSTSKMEEIEKASPDLGNMTKHEKLLYAVTRCFPAFVSDLEVCDLNLAELNDLQMDSYSRVWGEVKGQQTTEALSYQWTKSLWNTQLFTTLHIDTKNILIGHKKAPVPVFAAGLTLLEPTKGQALLKPDVLVDTSKSDPSLTSHSQESIPAAQFDWSSSGLTNPLEANNKTLNLDFLIQDQATKSNALESEFLSTNESPVHKPAIQPLENILANLKTSSTFKPTNQNEDISKEATKVLLSLPDLVFMKSKVLMFPVKMGGSEN